MQKYSVPSGICETWRRIMPGVRNARGRSSAGRRRRSARSGCPSAEALRDVAGDVDAQEVEGHALRAGPAQRRQPVADLLEARAEAVAQQLDVVALGARRLQERLVRHEHRGGEVVRERDAAERARLRRREVRVVGQALDRRRAG